MSPLLVLLTVPYAPAQEPNQAEDVACVEGLVFGNTGRPQVEVAIDFVQEELRRSALTDTRGSFHLCMEVGTWNLELRPPDSSAWRQPDLVLAGGETTEVLITLQGDREPIWAISGPPGVTTEVPDITEEVVMGILLGRITDMDSQPLSGASIAVRGSTISAISGEDGSFRLELPVGLQTLSVVLGGYTSRTVSDIEVFADVEVEAVVQLPEAGLALGEFTISAPRIPGGTATLMEERRNSASVSDVLGAEQMSRSGDSDAASALQRVTGLTVVGGKYVYVRGLGERYSASLLNGSTLPSPEPERRVVPLDLFPTSLLESVTIQKTFSPDRPAEFGGGVVALQTRSVPEEFMARLSVSSGYTHGATFQQGPLGHRGPLDWLTFGRGSRNLPASVQSASDGSPLEETDMFSSRGYTAEELEALGEDMSNHWGIEQGTAMPDMGLAATIGNGIGEDDGFRFGYLASLLWNNGWDRDVFQRQYFLVGAEDQLELAHSYTFESLVQESRLGGALALSAEFGENHSVQSTTLLNRSSDLTTRIYSGMNRDVGSDIRVTRIRWVERQLFFQHLTGSHTLPQASDIIVDWRYAYSNASRHEPDRREFRVDLEPDTDDWYLSDRPEGNSIFYSDLDDDNHDTGVDLTVPFRLPWTTAEGSFFKFGSSFVTRNRAVDTRRFKYMHKGDRANDSDVLIDDPVDIFVDENIGTDGFQFEEVTRQTDNYTAGQTIIAGYLMSELVPTDRVTLLAGARVEHSRQEVETFELFNPDQVPVGALLETTDVLPALTSTFRIGPDGREDEQQIRMGYGRTVSRPDFRELSPATFNDVTGGRQVYGNPDLDRALIDNIDLRWEWYPNPSESISLAAFYKHFTQPIESIVVVSAQHSVTYQNAESARNLGIELDARLSFGRIHSRLEDFYLAGNGALIRSRVQLSDNSGIQTSNERALEGQSPYVINVQMGYANPDSGTSISALYNVFGPRITEAGALGAPDYYEQPLHRVDLVGSINFADRWQLSLKGKNLLDSPTRVTTGTETVEEWTNGWSMSLGLSVSL